MMNVGISEAQGNLAEILDRVHRDKQRIALGNGEQTLAVLVPIEDLDLIEGRGDPASQDGEHRLEDFAETASGWFWETDMEQRYTYYSGAGPGNDPKGRDGSQGTPASMIGRTVSEAWDDCQDWEPDLIETIADDMMRGEPFRDLEFSYRDPKRGSVHITLSGKPVADDQGNVVAYRGTGRDITERRRAEKALQESEERFRHFAEAASDWFWETDAEHRFSWISDRVEDVTGVPAEFHIGKSRLELAADQIEQDKWRAHLAILEVRRPFRDFRYLRRGHDGRLQHMSASGVPVFDAEGNFKGYRGTGADISAEVTAEEMAAGAQAHFMAAIESVADGFALFDADDRMVFCNSRFKAMNPDLAPKLVPGVTFEELLRDNIAANRILDARGDEEAFIRERMAQHRNPSGPLVQQRRDGRWLELREEQTPEGSTFLVNTDITERKQAEQALRESEARLFKATEMAKIGYWVWDEVGDKAICCSEELAEMYGVASGDDLAAILSSHSGDLDWVHPEDRERFDEAVRIARETKRGYDIEYRIVHSEGEVRHLHDMVEPVADQRGDIIRTNGVTHDITDRKRVEEEIRKLNAELEQRVEERTAELRAAQSDLIRQERLATLGQLIATVSHELRNPLGVIRTSAFVVRECLNGAPPRVQRSLERIERNVVRCDRIIDEMLDFTRISELVPETTPIDDWLAGVLEEQSLPRGVSLQQEFGLPGTHIGVDRDRLRRAVINVFDNACQAMIESRNERAGAGGYVLTVRTGETAERVELIFEDTGPGIPPEIEPKVFEPLFSTKGFGVGLGLSVVDQVMEQHGGGVTIENREGGGARVCLWLPRDEAPS